MELMTKIFQDQKPKEIAAVIENNRIESYRNIWLSYDAKETKKEDYSLYASNLKIPLYNGVIDTNIEEEKVDERIDEVISFFDKQKLPFSWLSGVQPNHEIYTKV